MRFLNFESDPTGGPGTTVKETVEPDSLDAKIAEALGPDAEPKEIEVFPSPEASEPKPAVTPPEEGKKPAVPTEPSQVTAPPAPPETPAPPAKHKVMYDLDGQPVEEELSLEELAQARRDARLAGLAGRRFGEERQRFGAREQELLGKLKKHEELMAAVDPALQFIETLKGDEALYAYVKENLPGLEGGEDVDPTLIKVKQMIAPFEDWMAEQKVQAARNDGLQRLNEARGRLGYEGPIQPDEEQALHYAAQVAGFKTPYDSPLLPTMLYINLLALNGELVPKGSLNPGQSIEDASKVVDEKLRVGGEMPPAGTGPAPVTPTLKKPEDYATQRDYLKDQVDSGRLKKEFANTLLPLDQQLD